VVEVCSIHLTVLPNPPGAQPLDVLLGGNQREKTSERRGVSCGCDEVGGTRGSFL
jgi:hypothetical protein